MATNIWVSKFEECIIYFVQWALKPNQVKNNTTWNKKRTRKTWHLNIKIISEKSMFNIAIHDGNIFSESSLNDCSSPAINVYLHSITAIVDRKGFTRNCILFLFLFLRRMESCPCSRFTSVLLTTDNSTTKNWCPCVLVIIFSLSLSEDGENGMCNCLVIPSTNNF